MTPEMMRALRANPKLRKALRERQQDLLRALESGETHEVMAAAHRWAEKEREVQADLARKEAKPPLHRVTFLIEEHHYKEFCKIAAGHGLSPDEVARRYCLSGITFSDVVWHAINKGRLSDVIVTSPRRGLNLAQIALPRFTDPGPIGT